MSKQRPSPSGRSTGGVRFGYGPLAYLLKNRTYLGEMGHKGSWFAGEHEAIVDPALFNAVRELLKNNSVKRVQRRAENQSLLGGLLFDDRGNRMTPSFTTKRGVRYRFYVSSAVLAGRRDQMGSASRVAAPDIERVVASALRERFASSGDLTDHDLIGAHIERIALGQTNILITLKASDTTEKLIELTRSRQPASSRARIEHDHGPSVGQVDENLIHAVARAHLWLKWLSDGTYQSVDELAAVAKWNPKVIRKVLRLAFLAPDITQAIFLGSQPKSLSVSTLQGIAAYSWHEQRRLLEFPIVA